MAKKQEPWRQYTSAKWPIWVKALLLKWWGAGAVMYFGFALPTRDQLDFIVVIGLIMGAFTDFIINNILKMFEHGNHECEPFMMWGKGGMVSLVLNLLHGLLMVILVSLLYAGINIAIISAFHLTSKIVLGTEPILFGVFYTGFDMLFICVKRWIIQAFTKKNHPAQNEE